MAGYRVIKTTGKADYEYILIAPNGDELNGGDGLHNQAQLEIQASLIQQEVAKRDEAWNATVDLKDKRIIAYQEEIAKIKTLLNVLSGYDYDSKELGSIIVTLCRNWGVELAEYETSTRGHIYKTIQNLARHCLKAWGRD